MSYRSIKRLLGETGLEVKCRLLFATGLLILISGSFYFYSMLNLRVVREQQRERAELLIAHNIQSTHWTQTVDPEFVDVIQQLGHELKPQDLREDNWRFFPIDYDNSELYDASHRPSELPEIEAFREIVNQQAEFVVSEDEETGEQVYYQPVRAEEFCHTCHAAEEGHYPPFVRDGLLGVAKINFAPEKVNAQINRNKAVLLTMAIATSALAMFATAVIVRYVIVKPVQHLNEVSDAIAHGDLDQRADIRTGDEFEELSHAFNRMLRHLTTIQDELRQANTTLDAKVDELAQANLSLHAMNKLKSDFLATMSHELRTPLNSILGFSDVLSSAQNLNDRQKKYLDNINTSGQNLLALINDILDLAKIEAGKMEVFPREVVVEDLVEQTVSSMMPLAERKNIDLSHSVDPAIPVLRQDLGKLQQILNNLLSNAIKFTPEGGRIRVQAQSVDEETIDLIIADTGIGIPLEDQSTIFEKFRQGRGDDSESDTLTREFEGTGLGLSIVKELCRLLEGEIFLDSEFGKGSTFTVRLPVEVEPGMSTPDNLADPPLVSPQHPRVAS
ncbi:MAG: HAMP domain-containing protein [Planctomycetota bacterium]|nr:MAG: HAMP domain-containing protein [Planctomycetota bacterium]